MATHDFIPFKGESRTVVHTKLVFSLQKSFGTVKTLHLYGTHVHKH